MKLQESETLELKKSTAQLKEAVISIVSILNKHGEGQLYFGVNDDGEVVGQIAAKTSLRNISRTIHESIEPKIYPEISRIMLDGKSCILIEFSGNSAPYYAFGRAYKRIADEDRPLSAKEIESMVLEKNKDSFRWEICDSEYDLSSIDEKELKNFIKKSNDAGRIPFSFDNPKNTLLKLGLIKSGKMLRAAEVLFYSKNLLAVQAAVFAGTDKLTFLDIQQFKGTMFLLIDRSEEYIKEHMNWRVEINRIERTEIPEVPVRAIREALVNSFCHRDYFFQGSNRIAIFKDRIEISNVGSFPNGLTPDDFIRHSHASVLRNPLIADILYKCKAIESWGSGLRRIYDECRQSGVRVEFEAHKDEFKVVFYRNDTTPKTTPKTTPSIRDKILLAILHNPGITKEQIARSLGLTIEGIRYHIRWLRHRGRISWKGSSREGCWAVVEKSSKESGQNGSQKVSGRQQDMLEIITQNPFVTRKELIDKLGINPSAIQKHICKLKKKGLLKRVGPDKGGHWKVSNFSL